jgi:predicted component of type VI protein secretion system
MMSTQLLRNVLQIHYASPVSDKYADRLDIQLQSSPKTNPENSTNGKMLTCIVLQWATCTTLQKQPYMKDKHSPVHTATGSHV